MLLSISCDKNNNEKSELWDWTEHTEFGRRAIWSPAGDMILFGDDTRGSPGLYIWQLDNDPQELDLYTASHNWDYCWSPSGDKIAFTSPASPHDTLSGIWIYELASGESYRLYDSGSDVTWYFDELSVAVRLDNPPGNLPGIYRISWTGDYQDITKTLIVENGYKPVCSPKFPFMAYTTSEIRSQLYVIDMDGELVFSSGFGVVQWNWSRSARKIAYVINDYNSGTLEGVLWIASLDNPENPDSLTRSVEFSSIDNDGSQVAFTRVLSARYGGLWIHRNLDQEVKLSNVGLEPSFDQVGNRLAVHSSDGGIRILSRTR